MKELPRGLCPDRGDHGPHVRDSPGLGRFWCSADQEVREPARSDRARQSGAQLSLAGYTAGTLAGRPWFPVPGDAGSVERHMCCVLAPGHVGRHHYREVKWGTFRTAICTGSPDSEIDTSS